MLFGLYVICRLIVFVVMIGVVIAIGMLVFAFMVTFAFVWLVVALIRWLLPEGFAARWAL